MKTLTVVAFTVLAAMTLTAQTKPSTAAVYDRALSHAVSETNTTFPFILNAVTETYDRGKIVAMDTATNERPAPGVVRGTMTMERGGKVLRTYTIAVGFGEKTYCSFDGIVWTGPQKFGCPSPDRSEILVRFEARTPESVEYSVTEKSLGGNPVKVYRKYATFPPTELQGKKTYVDEIATVDARGLFVSVTTDEGTLAPHAVTRITNETWDFITKIKPVVAPK